MPQAMISRHRAMIPVNRNMILESPAGDQRTRVLLVMIARDLLPPIIHENNPLQRMRVMRVEPGGWPWLDPSQPMPGPQPEVLPPVQPILATAEGLRLRPRMVTGEVMRDQAGRLYEKSGLQLCPLHHLVSGPNGEILELVPNAPQTAPGEFLPPEQIVSLVDEDAAERERDAKEARNAQGRHGQTTWRKLLPDPGEWRVVRLGDFKEILATQLSHPERLQDSHRLACYVQVYEVTRAQRIELLAAAILGGGDRARQLCPLNMAAAARLQLMPLLQRRPHIPPEMRAERGLLLPNDRLCRLQLVSDPTADRPDAEQEGSRNVSEPRLPSSLTTDAKPSSATKSPDRGKAIPERFFKPWEFLLSREEALYDVKAGRHRHWIHRVKSWFRSRSELRKWRALLAGKNTEEQLWSVRPPKGGISDPSVLEWARERLETAGYDSATMLLEWQVYWRRKGLA